VVYAIGALDGRDDLFRVTSPRALVKGAALAAAPSTGPIAPATDKLPALASHI
jgi:hypothetical protein